VIFGGAGDLSFRKLLPALYMAHAHGKLEGDTRIIGIGRQAWSRAQYLEFINEQSPPFIEANVFKQDDWQSFLNRLAIYSARPHQSTRLYKTEIAVCI
jgi:glucose-6-phosphate 1-dehydrogenase